MCAGCTDCASHCLAFVAAKIIEYDDVTGRSNGSRNCTTQAKKVSPLIGPSVAQDPVMPSVRNAAWKAVVPQWLCGTRASRRCPRGARPCVRVMSVLAQVSSVKPRRLGSTRAWQHFQRARFRATSGRTCSAACRGFCIGEPLCRKKIPHGAVANFSAAPGQLGA